MDCFCGFSDPLNSFQRRWFVLCVTWYVDIQEVCPCILGAQDTEKWKLHTRTSIPSSGGTEGCKQTHWTESYKVGIWCWFWRSYTVWLCKLILDKCVRQMMLQQWRGVCLNKLCSQTSLTVWFNWRISSKSHYQKCYFSSRVSFMLKMMMTLLMMMTT